MSAFQIESNQPHDNKLQLKLIMHQVAPIITPRSDQALSSNQIQKLRNFELKKGTKNCS